MALTERHRWCIEKIREAFGDELNSEAVNTFMRQEAVTTKFAQFFAGESSGRLFVFYQPEALEDGVRRISTWGSPLKKIGNEGMKCSVLGWCALINAITLKLFMKKVSEFV